MKKIMLNFSIKRLLLLVGLILILIFTPAIPPYQSDLITKKEQPSIFYGWDGGSYQSSGPHRMIDFKGINFPKFRSFYINTWKKFISKKYKDSAAPFSFLFAHAMVLFCMIWFCLKPSRDFLWSYL